jgi:hypothetical protein
LGADPIRSIHEFPQSFLFDRDIAGQAVIVGHTLGEIKDVASGAEIVISQRSGRSCGWRA